jgi:FtsH-binding integral membrane protein
MDIFKTDPMIGIFFLIVNILLITKFSFKNGVPTCDNYVFNVYLYLTLGCIMFYLFLFVQNKIMFSKENEKKILPNNEVWEQYNKYSSFQLLGILFSIIMLIFYMPEYFTKKSYSSLIISHLLYITCVYFLSGLTIPYFKSDKYYKYITEACKIILSIFAVMSGVVYSFPSFFEKTFNYVYSALFVSLFVTTLFTIITLFTSNKTDFLSMQKIISYIVIVIFSLFISYDTQQIFNNSKLCNVKRIANYPSEGLNFFLDFINIFNRILFVRTFNE